MTKAQEDAMDRIAEIMNEHFRAGILVVVVDIEGKDGDHIDGHRLNYNGGIATGLGLLKLAEHKLINLIEE